MNLAPKRIVSDCFLRAEPQRAFQRGAGGRCNVESVGHGLPPNALTARSPQSVQSALSRLGVFGDDEAQSASVGPAVCAEIAVFGEASAKEAVLRPIE